jgi:hypothetical protein
MLCMKEDPYVEKHRRGTIDMRISVRQKVETNFLTDEYSFCHTPAIHAVDWPRTLLRQLRKKHARQIFHGCEAACYRYLRCYARRSSH